MEKVLLGKRYFIYPLRKANNIFYALTTECDNDVNAQIQYPAGACQPDGRPGGLFGFLLRRAPGKNSNLVAMNQVFGPGN